MNKFTKLFIILSLVLLNTAPAWAQTSWVNGSFEGTKVGEEVTLPYGKTFQYFDLEGVETVIDGVKFKARVGIICDKGKTVCKFIPASYDEVKPSEARIAIAITGLFITMTVIIPAIVGGGGGGGAGGGGAGGGIGGGGGAPIGF